MKKNLSAKSAPTILKKIAQASPLMELHRLPPLFYPTKFFPMGFWPRPNFPRPKPHPRQRQSIVWRPAFKSEKISQRKIRTYNFEKNRAGASPDGAASIAATFLPHKNFSDGFLASTKFSEAQASSTTKTIYSMAASLHK